MFVNWITKLPDGSKPSTLLKKKIVNLLNILNFDSDFIPDKILGRFLMSISKNESKGIFLILVESMET